MPDAKRGSELQHQRTSPYPIDRLWDGRGREDRKRMLRYIGQTRQKRSDLVKLGYHDLPVEIRRRILIHEVKIRISLSKTLDSKIRWASSSHGRKIRTTAGQKKWEGSWAGQRADLLRKWRPNVDAKSMIDTPYVKLPSDFRYWLETSNSFKD